MLFFFSSDITILLARNQKIVDNYQNKITNLETELAKKESQLLQERQVKEDLMNQAFAAAQFQDGERNYFFLILFTNCIRGF